MKAWLLGLLALPWLAMGAEQRLITIGGDVTEIVYALDGQQHLVARDSTSLSPEAATTLPDIGYMRQLNAEGILALRPTLILASSQAKPSLALEQVANSGAKVVTIPADNSLQGIDAKISAVAAALHKEPQGRALQQRLTTALSAIPSQPLDKKVLFIMSHGGMSTMAAGQQTAADAAINAAGLHNAMQGFTRYQPLSQEGVIASAPDLVLVTRDGIRTLGGEEQLWALPGLAHTPAGKQRQLMVVDDMALLGFGIRTPQAIAELRQRAETLP